jgi:hypothetical protein
VNEGAAPGCGLTGRAEKIELPGRVLLSFIRALRASKKLLPALDDSIDAIPGGLVEELSSAPVTKGQGRICFLILAAAIEAGYVISFWPSCLKEESWPK